MLASAIPALIAFPVMAQGPAGAANRVADRARRNIARRHSIVSFTAATAAQRRIAMENARKAQEKLRQEWERKNRSSSKGKGSTQVPMSTVVSDLNKPRVQAVKTSPSAGAKSSVVAVDVTTGNLVSGTVVNSSQNITGGTNISEQVRTAADDPEVPGNPPSEFVRGNISLAAI